MSIWVTGGAGFLGTNLCLALLDAGHDVVALDNLCTGSKENVQMLEARRGFTFIHHDVTQSWPKARDVQIVFNLASPASPIHYTRLDVETMNTNALGIINAVAFCQQSGSTLLQASTSEVYGDPLEHPQRETYYGHVNPIGPRSCYDESKRFAESYLYTAGNRLDLDYRMARIFNTYGPYMALNDGRVVSNFILAALRNEPLDLYGGGGQTRSFCYVDDLIQGLLTLASEPKAKRQVVNLGNPAEITVKQLAEQVIHACGSSSEVRIKGIMPDDPKKRKPDIARAKSLLGWSPKIPLAQGIEKTVTYFRGRIA